MILYGIYAEPALDFATDFAPGLEKSREGGGKEGYEGLESERLYQHTRTFPLPSLYFPEPQPGM